jgi:hypothetical protein
MFRKFINDVQTADGGLYSYVHHVFEITPPTNCRRMALSKKSIHSRSVTRSLAWDRNTIFGLCCYAATILLLLSPERVRVREKNENPMSK